MASVVFKNFAIGINDRFTLNKTDLEIEQGSSTVIIGPTGTGKSVFLKSIAGVLPLRTFSIHGDLTINGIPAYADGIKSKRKVWNEIEDSGLSFIPAETAQVLNPSLTLEQNVSIIAPGCKEKITSLLSKYFDIDFSAFSYNYPDEVSGGQIQRITLMMLLSRQSSIILLDEPTVNLDRDLRSSFAEFLNKEILTDTTKTLVMVSHDLDFIEKIHFTDLLLLKDGNVSKTTLDKDEVGNESRKFEPEKTENKIKLMDVSQTYEKRTLLSERTFEAFNHLNLELSESVVYGITGPSGCGKTSMVKAILRLLNGTKGDIFFEDKNLVLLKPDENGVDPKEFKGIRSEMSIVQQDSRFSFIPDLKIRDSILQIVQNHGNINLELVVQNMEKVGLSSSYLDLYPHNLSSGEIKRLDISMALSFKPKLLVLDEPFAHIDIGTRSSIMELISSHMKANKLFLIIITHEDFDLKCFVEKNYDFTELV